MGNFDYLIEVLDWETNVDPDFYKNRAMKPKPAKDPLETVQEGYIDEWICYKSDKVCAKRLTVLPGRTAVIRDAAAYGFIMIQGHGTCGVWDIETPALIRYGEHTHDEFFVSEGAAKDGVAITNLSASEPLVMLKHFAENPELILTKD